jgi:hypothetical protein
VFLVVAKVDRSYVKNNNSAGGIEAWSLSTTRPAAPCNYDECTQDFVHALVAGPNGLKRQPILCIRSLCVRVRLR